jgi:membrane-associated HD superfamily phosphohydrolase
MKRIDKGEFVIPLILIALSVFLYVNTYTFKFTTYQKASPQMWPRGILLLLLLISLLLIGKLLLAKPWEGTEAKKEQPGTRWKPLLAGVVGLFLYIFTMFYVGYILSTFLFTFVAMVMLGNRSKVQLVLVPVLITGSVFAIFTHAMFVPLPKGVWLFRDFSLLFH